MEEPLQVIEVTDAEFAVMWNKASTPSMLAATLGLTCQAVGNRATRLRKEGYGLKRMRKPSPSTAARTDGRPNHRPVADYCEGVDFGDDGVDALLERLNNPRGVMPNREEQQQLTDGIYARAAMIRAARPADSSGQTTTREDQPLPVAMNVIDTTDINGNTHATYGRR
jgi:hypothetical protein